MVHIRTWIFIPLLVLLLLFPVGVVLIFNITSGDYAQKAAEEELKETLDVVLPIAEELLYDLEASDYDNTEAYTAAQTERARTFLKTIRSSVRQNSSGAQLIVIDRNMEMAYPDADTAFEDTQDVYHYYVGQLSKADTVDIPIEEITRITLNDKEYLVYIMQIQVVKYNRYLIAFSELEDISELLRVSTWMLLIITSVLAVIVIIAMGFISIRLSRPIERFCSYTRQISQGSLNHIDEKSRIYEIAALSTELNDMAGRLRQYENDRRTFYQNVAHELRTPLMSIRGYAEGIQCGAFPDNRDAAETIIAQSMRLSDMAGELLLISELENSGISVDIESIAAAEFLKEQVHLTEGAAISNGILVKCEFEDNTIVLNADGELLSKAVTNILANCIRYAHTTVRVRLKKADDKAVIQISDDGDGIAQESLEHIFERFYKGRGGKTGLGLSIAKAAMEAMQGEIAAFNTASGAAFELIIACTADKMHQ